MTINLNVLIPVYNEEKTLPHCLRALSLQTLKPTRVIIVNDDCTDRSMEVVKKHMDDTFLIVNLNRRKVGCAAYDYAVALGFGSRYLEEDFDYVAILDADTVLEPCYYERIVKRLRRDPCIGIAGGAYIGIEDRGLMLGVYPVVWGCNRVITRRCWLNVNGGTVMKVIYAPDVYQHMQARNKFGYHPTRFEDVKSYALRRESHNWFEAGFLCWKIGYHGWFMVFRAFKRRAPMLLAGFMKGWATGASQYSVKTLVRRLQLTRIKKVLHMEPKMSREEMVEVARRVERAIYEKVA